LRDEVAAGATRALAAYAGDEGRPA
jgi:hypothetical protein